MRKLFLKRIFCLFKKVIHDKEYQPRSAVRIGLVRAFGHLLPVEHQTVVEGLQQSLAFLLPDAQAILKAEF